mmetsp:Transcript_41226/g.122337  ORF Transcript_41226/g.122337 Transcript_41226/m.122337 type:complete len:323 (-) Transcript_41226:5-973(-)
MVALWFRQFCSTLRSGGASGSVAWALTLKQCVACRSGWPMWKCSGTVELWFILAATSHCSAKTSLLSFFSILWMSFAVWLVAGPTHRFWSWTGAHLHSCSWAAAAVRAWRSCQTPQERPLCPGSTVRQASKPIWAYSGQGLPQSFHLISSFRQRMRRIFAGFRNLAGGFFASCPKAPVTGSSTSSGSRESLPSLPISRSSSSVFSMSPSPLQTRSTQKPFSSMQLAISCPRPSASVRCATSMSKLRSSPPSPGFRASTLARTLALSKWSITPLARCTRNLPACSSLPVYLRSCPICPFTSGLSSSPWISTRPPARRPSTSGS